jgi:hypothetical protein
MRNALHLSAAPCEQARRVAVKGIVARSVIEQAFLGWWCGAAGKGKLADVHKSRVRCVAVLFQGDDILLVKHGKDGRDCG